MAYLLNFRLTDRLLAGKNGHCVEFVDVFVLVGGGKGLDDAFDDLLLRVGVVSREDEAGGTTHLEVGSILRLLGGDSQYQEQHQCQS